MSEREGDPLGGYKRKCALPTCRTEFYCRGGWGYKIGEDKQVKCYCSYKHMRQAQAEMEAKQKQSQEQKRKNHGGGKTPRHKITAQEEAEMFRRFKAGEKGYKAAMETGININAVYYRFTKWRAEEEQKTGGCNGCAYRGSEDCPLDLVDDGNFFCPNGRLV